jgi:hypothetical protein
MLEPGTAVLAEGWGELTQCYTLLKRWVRLVGRSGFRIVAWSRSSTEPTISGSGSPTSARTDSPSWLRSSWPLGHEVIAREIDVDDVGAVTARERPDVALVGLGESSAHALELIDKIVRRPPAP